MAQQSMEDILKEAREETIRKPVKKVNKWLAIILVILCIVNVAKESFSLGIGMDQFFGYTLATLVFSMFASYLIALIPFTKWDYDLRAYRLLLLFLIIFQGIFLLM